MNTTTDTTTQPFQVGDPVEHRGIVVAPLFPRRDPVSRYVTLDVGLERGLRITETSESGDVPEQNRILNVSVLVAAGTTLAIPVSCVEEGRWRSVSDSFAPARHISGSELRRRKARALAARPLVRGAAQKTVWASAPGCASTRSPGRTRSRRSGPSCGPATCSTRSRGSTAVSPRRSGCWASWMRSRTRQ